MQGVADRRAARVRRVSRRPCGPCPGKRGGARKLAGGPADAADAGGRTRAAALQAAEEEATRLAEALTESRPRLIQLKRRDAKGLRGVSRASGSGWRRPGARGGGGTERRFGAGAPRGGSPAGRFPKILAAAHFSVRPAGAAGRGRGVARRRPGVPLGFRRDGYTLGGGTAAAWLAVIWPRCTR